MLLRIEMIRCLILHRVRPLIQVPIRAIAMLNGDLDPFLGWHRCRICLLLLDKLLAGLIQKQSLRVLIVNVG